jgi:hypothetical protein
MLSGDMSRPYYSQKYSKGWDSLMAKEPDKPKQNVIPDDHFENEPSGPNMILNGPLPKELQDHVDALKKELGITWVPKNK